jgi:hypothetical protein
MDVGNPPFRNPFAARQVHTEEHNIRYLQRYIFALFELSGQGWPCPRQSCRLVKSKSW